MKKKTILIILLGIVLSIEFVLFINEILGPMVETLFTIGIIILASSVTTIYVQERQREESKEA